MPACWIGPLSDVVSIVHSAPITLLPVRAPHDPEGPTYSTRLLNRASPFRSPSIPKTAQSPGILVIDDEADIRAVVSDILIEEGYLVLQAADGADALTVVDRARVSLAMLDMRMPVLDGWGFARALRERRKWLPILVMSAAIDARHWADDIGAAGCVSKPFDLLDLVTQVERLVSPH